MLWVAAPSRRVADVKVARRAGGDAPVRAVAEGLPVEMVSAVGPVGAHAVDAQLADVVVALEDGEPYLAPAPGRAAFPPLAHADSTLILARTGTGIVRAR